MLIGIGNVQRILFPFDKGENIYDKGSKIGRLRNIPRRDLRRSRFNVQSDVQSTDLCIDAAPTDAVLVPDKGKIERKDQLAQRQRTADLRARIRLRQLSFADGAFQRSEVQPAQIGKEGRTIRKRELSEKVAVLQENTLSLIGEIEIPKTQTQTAELSVLHRKCGVTDNTRCTHVCFQFQKRLFLRQKRCKPRRKIIQRRKFFLFRLRYGRIRIIDKIRLVSGYVHVRKIVGIGGLVAPLAVGFKSLFGRIFFRRLQRSDRPVLFKAENKLCGRKGRIIVQIAHRAHLAFIIFCRVLFSLLRTFTNGKRDGEDIPVPVLFHRRIGSEQRLLRDHIVAEFRRPKAVTVDVLRLVQNFRRLFRRPFRGKSVPVGFFIRLGIADQRGVLSVKSLHRLGGSKGTFARTDRGDDVDAVLVILAADDVLLDVDHAAQS